MKQEVKRRRLVPDLIFSTLYNEYNHHNINNHSGFAHMAKYGRSEEDILKNILGENLISTHRTSKI